MQRRREPSEQGTLSWALQHSDHCPFQEGTSPILRVVLKGDREMTHLLGVTCGADPDRANNVRLHAQSLFEQRVDEMCKCIEIFCKRCTLVSIGPVCNGL